MERLAGRQELAPDEVGELIDRIDAERAGRVLVTGLTTLPVADRALVDLAGLQPKEAAQVLGVAPGTLRMRLMRAGPGCARQPVRIWRTAPILRVSQR